MRYLQQNHTAEKIEPDLKDRKILTLLGANARTPLTQIAKQVGLSRDAVSYRVAQLERHGVIQGYRTVIDIKRFGYDAYHIFLRLTHAEKQVEERLITRFQHYPFARAVITCRGKYDVELAVVAKTGKEFDAILDQVLEDCGDNLQEYDVLMTTSSYVGHVLPQSFHPAPQQKQHKRLEHRPDETDAAILRQLANDATMPVYTIAKAVKLSDDAVTYRMRKLQAGGIITKFVPVINFSSISYSVYTVLMRTGGLTQAQRQMLAELLRQDRNVLWAVKCIGRYSMLAYICAKSAEELNETIGTLRQHLSGNILDYEVLIAYEEHKYTYFPDYALL